LGTVSGNWVSNFNAEELQDLVLTRLDLMKEVKVRSR
jgi:hypothetical protein